jgi:hypothetical protein
MTNVTIKSVEAKQRGLTTKEMRSVDYWEAMLIKHPGVSRMVGEATFLNAYLLEASSRISQFIPRPFEIGLGKTELIPSFWIQDDTGQSVVQVGRSEGLDEFQQSAIAHSLSARGLMFQVIERDAVFEREQEAQNWRLIVKTLVQGRGWNTGYAEDSLVARFRKTARRRLELRDITDPGRREACWLDELACFRLLHRGVITTDELVDRPLGYDTGFWLCP